MSEVLRQRLEAVLAAYGADPLRWPDDERAILSRFVADSGKPLLEAQEIDRILAAAPPPRGEEQSHLGILNAVEASRIGGPESIVVFPPGRRGGLPWLTALPLAASLVLGFYLGAIGTLDSILPAALVDNVEVAGDDPSDLSGMSDVEELVGDDLT